MAAKPDSGNGSGRIDSQGRGYLDVDSQSPTSLQIAMVAPKRGFPGMAPMPNQARAAEKQATPAECPL